MPKDNDTGPPYNVRPYLFHGVDLSWKAGKQAVGRCPWCTGEGRFTVDSETGKGNCFTPSCRVHETAKGGFNPTSFMRMLWEDSFRQTSVEHYKSLCVDRRYLSDEALIAWGAAKSFITGEWILPGYSPAGKLITLYARRKQRHEKKGWMNVMKATAGVEVGIYGYQNWSDHKDRVYIAEGPWDGIALHEILTQVRYVHEGLLELTASVEQSIYGSSNIISVPGANTFREEWLPILKGRDVILVYDNDQPGQTGAKRLCKLVEGSRYSPRSVKMIWWGDTGLINPNLPEGWDIRDALSNEVEAIND